MVSDVQTMADMVYATGQGAVFRAEDSPRAIRTGLADARFPEHRVGLRPFRPRARLESERLANGALCVHNYVHGGAG